jgi:hypothetical protein
VREVTSRTADKVHTLVGYASKEPWARQVARFLDRAAAVADHVAAIAVFGNPSASHVGPITGMSPLYGAKAIDLCNPGGPVCSPGSGMSLPRPDEMVSGPHVQYVQSGMPGQAAAFAASRLGPRGPRLSGGRRGY